ncbi:MAG: gephyrin-like molybdotransferase Glp [Halieaceae bacterium]|nr:gephyrin-like molybdotransferase Glp [Halieaceae bacterium]
MAGLTPLEEALALILEDVAPVAETDSVPLADALGRTLAEDVLARVPVPNDDNSAMDGYALRAEESGQVLRVTQRIPAGSAGETVVPGSAARIFTGAPIPPGADAVVMQENCELEGDKLQLTQAVVAGENIRRAGQDLEQGSRVLAAGRRLQPEDLGVLASVGCGEVSVFRRLVVGVLSTGDELVEPGTADSLAPGQIFNSNRYTLQGLLQALGFEVKDFGLVPDDAAETRRVLQAAADSCDCVISTGGVSVGEEDHVKHQVEALGSLKLWKLRVKPGKPLAYGRIGSTGFFGLPGNPAAVYVTFTMIVRPWLLACQGADPAPPLSLSAAADFDFGRAGSRLEFLRGRVSSTGQGLRAELHANQSSGVLSSVSWANALVVIPPGLTVARGDAVEVLLLDQLSR